MILLLLMVLKTTLLLLLGLFCPDPVSNQFFYVVAGCPGRKREKSVKLKIKLKLGWK